MRKGFTIIEMVIALVIISIILLVVVPLGQTAMDNSRIANAIASVKAIQTAAVEWQNDNGGQFTGITLDALATGGYLPAGFSSVTQANPWSGSYTLAPNANNSEMLDVTLSAVPSTPAAKLSTELTKLSAITGGPIYSPTSQTWTITLQ